MTERAGQRKGAAPKDDATDPRGESPAGPDDPTQLLSSPRAGGARLIVVAGPKAGSEYTLGDGTISVGRGTDNQIMIPDLSVSRRHVTVEKTVAGWAVRDLGSGNGTRVNGREVQLHDLRHGDEVAVGDSVLRFVEEGGVVVRSARSTRAQAAPAEEAIEAKEKTEVAPPPKRPSGWRALAPEKRRFYLIAFVAVGLLLALGVARQARRASQARRDAALQEEREARRLAGEKFEEARELIKQGRWAEAKDALVIAQGLAPGDAEVQRYLERALREAGFAQKLRDAQLFLEKKELAAARELVAAVSPDSALAEPAEALKRRIEEAAMAQAEAQAAAEEAAAKEAAARPSRPTSKAEPAAPPAVKPAVSQEIAAILDLYRDGDLKGAMERADEAAGLGSREAGDLKRRIGAFDAARREGLQRVQAQKPAEAARALEQALKFDHEISGGKRSRPGQEVAQELSRQHFLLGMEAKGDENLGRAAQHFRAAAEADPANEAAGRQLERAVARAKELYLEGYVARTTDPEAARRIFRRVIQVLPPGDETYEKAKRWLDQLEGRRTTPADPQ